MIGQSETIKGFIFNFHWIELDWIIGLDWIGLDWIIFKRKLSLWNVPQTSREPSFSRALSHLSQRGSVASIKSTYCIGQAALIVTISLNWIDLLI